jgi:hypothetical protein
MPNTDSAGGIQVGDAVIEFLGNTQQLDGSIDGLNAKIESGMSRASQSVGQLDDALDNAGETATEAGGVIDEAVEKSTVNIREARGEAMLLGEAFGVHLPRHVTSFVATLPGVGEALESAFAATAVIFIAEAIVKLTEKVTNFISTTFIYTQAMKEADAITASLNATILENEANIEKLNTAYDAMTMTPMQLLTKQLDDVNAKIAHQQEEFRAASDEMYGYRNGLIQLTDAEKKQSENIIISNKTVMESLADENRNLSTQIDKLYSDAAKKAKEVTEKNMATFNELMQQQRNYAGQLSLELSNLIAKANSELSGIRFPEELTAPGLNKISAGFAAADAAAQKYGVTLKSDLVDQMIDMQKAFDAMAKSENVDQGGLAAFGKQIDALRSKIATFSSPQATNQVNQFFEAFSKGGQQSSAAISGFGDAYGEALGKAIAGEEGFGQAMKAATKQFIDQIGMRALTQGMYYAAQGVADLFWFPERAAADFEASAMFLAIGAAGVASASAIGGGSSGQGVGGGSYGGTGTTGNVTSGTRGAPGPATTTTKLAGGGLISSPTIAMIGDAPGGGAADEAVMPLDSPEAMAKIAAALGPHLGGGSDGSSHTLNGTFFGSIRHSDLKRLTRQINQAVNKGTATLNSTRTGRIVKRSA